MGDYFRPLRRKIGVGTLVMALAFTGVWVRSLSVLDLFTFSQQQSCHAMFSMDGAYSWRRLSPFNEVMSPGWSMPPKWVSSELTMNRSNNYKVYWDDGDVHWHWRWSGFDFGAASFECLSQIPGNAGWIRREEIWQIPYWSIVIPLILLTAYLLLIKPRPKNTDTKST